MKNPATHTERFGRVLAIFFLAANAGYTVDLEYCTTECVTMCAMETCADRMACTTPCPEPLPAHHVAFVPEESDCHKVAIAGGLNSMPMVSGPVQERQISWVYLLSCDEAQDVVSPEPPRADSCISSPAGVARHHAVEKYLLHSSYLM